MSFLIRRLIKIYLKYRIINSGRKRLDYVVYKHVIPNYIIL